MLEIEDAMVKVTMGPEKRTRVRSEKENKLVAYHEAGHAVVSRFLPTQDAVHQISIVPRGMARRIHDVQTKRRQKLHV
jgi:cell division protease FtsH